MTTIALPARGQSAYSRPIDPYIQTSITRAEIVDQVQERWGRVVHSLLGLLSLRDNWDGQGAVAPFAGLVRSAVELAETLRHSDAPPPTTAVATPAGTILFGWNGSSYFEIEVLAPDRAEWLSVNQDGVATHGEISSR